MIEEVKPNVYLKKNTFNKWHQVYPIKKDMSKPFRFHNIHWKNFLIGGSIGRFVGTLLFICIILFMAWSYARDTAECRYLLEHPPYCTCITAAEGGWDVAMFNVSELLEVEEEDEQHSLPIFTQSNDEIG